MGLKEIFQKYGDKKILDNMIKESFEDAILSRLKEIEEMQEQKKEVQDGTKSSILR